MAKHDLIFFERRSTPKVVKTGTPFTAPESYGKQTRRRPATEAEEKVIARGEWVRVDQSGKKGGEPGYKKTRMKGRKHLVEHLEQDSEELFHYGVKGMRWGVRKDEGSGSASSPALSEKKQKKVDSFFNEAEKARASVKEMEELGINSPAMREAYGKAVDRSDRLFAIVYGQSKDQAVQQQIQYESKRAEYLMKNAEAIQAGKLTSNQKLAMVGGVAAAAVIGYAGYTYATDSRDQNADVGDRISVNVFQRRYNESSSAFYMVGLKSFDSLDNNDIRVPSGTVFSRITAYKDESLDGRMYTTFLPGDNDKYQGVYGPVLRSRTMKARLYVSKMTTGEDVRSPSHRRRVELYADMLRELSGQPDTPEVRAKYNQKALDNYNIFARQLVVKSPTSDRYFDMVRKAGYNAILDDNDAGQLSDMPMILLNPKATVKSRQMEPLTFGAERAARKRFTEIRRLDKHGNLIVPDQYKDVAAKREKELVHTGMLAAAHIFPKMDLLTRDEKGGDPWE